MRCHFRSFRSRLISRSWLARSSDSRYFCQLCSTTKEVDHAICKLYTSSLYQMCKNLLISNDQKISTLSWLKHSFSRVKHPLVAITQGVDPGFSNGGGGGGGGGGAAKYYESEVQSPLQPGSRVCLKGIHNGRKTVDMLWRKLCLLRK